MAGNRTSTNEGTLVIVTCHAVYLGGPSHGEDESEWLIESFQMGETPTFIEHMRRGVEELSKCQDQGLLVFSGGATKKLKTQGKIQRTEAEGYADLAFKHHYFGFDDSKATTSRSLQDAVFEERWATDSYQNVLLSLIQYPIWQQQLRQRLNLSNKITHNPTKVSSLALPKRLVIVSHEFKRARFQDLHLPAIRSIWPSSDTFDAMSVEYIGINPPFDEVKMREIEEGDRKRGYGVWKDDVFGNGTLLNAKRIERGWDEDSFMHYIKDYLDSNVMGTVCNLLTGVKKQLNRVVDKV